MVGLPSSEPIAFDVKSVGAGSELLKASFQGVLDRMTAERGSPRWLLGVRTEGRVMRQDGSDINRARKEFETWLSGLRDPACCSAVLRVGALSIHVRLRSPDDPISFGSCSVSGAGTDEWAETLVDHVRNKGRHASEKQCPFMLIYVDRTHELLPDVTRMELSGGVPLAVQTVTQQPSVGTDYWLGVVDMVWGYQDDDTPICYGCFTDSPYWPDGAKHDLNARLDVKLP